MEKVPSQNTDLPGQRFPSPQGNTLAFSLQFSRIRPLGTGRSNAESKHHARGYPGIETSAKSWTHEKLQLAMTWTTPETPAGSDQPCLKPTALWANGGPSLSPEPPPQGLCRVLTTPGRPTWNVLPVPLLLGQGVFGVLQSRAARWVVLAGVGRPLLTACMEGKGKRRIEVLWVILTVWALRGLGSALLPCRHSWGTHGCRASPLPGRPAASSHTQQLAKTERGQLHLPMARNPHEFNRSAGSTPCRPSRSPRGDRGGPVP